MLTDTAEVTAVPRPGFGPSQRCGERRQPGPGCAVAHSVLYLSEHWPGYPRWGTEPRARFGHAEGSRSAGFSFSFAYEVSVISAGLYEGETAILHNEYSSARNHHVPVFCYSCAQIPSESSFDALYNIRYATMAMAICPRPL